MIPYKTEKLIYETLLKIKPPHFYKGYYQFKLVLALILEKEGDNCNLSKEIYPVIAEKCKCAPDSVERNIRTFIKGINRDKLTELLGCEVKEKISVKDFTYMIVGYLQNVSIDVY